MKRGTPRHPKTFGLAGRLRIPLPMAVGILEMLWEFTGDHCPQGNIGALPDRAIANAVGWEKKPALLIDALCQERWLDVDDEHRLVVHDWPDHAEYEVCRKLTREHKDFLGIYGKSVRDRRAPGAPNSRISAVIPRKSSASRGATVNGSGSYGEVQEGPLDPLYDRYHDLIASWENPDGIDLGMQLWIMYVDDGTITSVNVGEVFDGLDRHKKSKKWAQGYRMAVDRWLREKRWKDWPEAVGSSGKPSPYSLAEGAE